MEIVKLLKRISKGQMVLLRYITSFLNRVSLQAEHTRMTSKALADIMCPLVSTECRGNNMALFKMLIEHPEWIPKSTQKDNAPFPLFFAEEVIMQTEHVQLVGDDGLSGGDRKSVV